ncbi:MAG TPA: ACR3 family arsenite efflux transporter [Gaiellaceae bacterium]|nr:ACR3 family arsenite efflux transporter [Gaiellaceae bacterium]
MAVLEERERAAGTPPGDEGAVLAKLSTLDRFLPLWIGLAMAAGLALGSLIPSLNDGLDRLRIGTVSLPIALGLLLMMYPVLAKVRYEELGRTQHDGVSNRLFYGTSLFLSWVIGPLFMFALAWLFLADQPEYRTGVIIVGLARCIAMVLIWNDLAQGDRDRAAVLVVFNAVFQVAAYSLLGYFYLTLLPGWLGLDTQGFEVGIWEVARTVLIFLGIPLAAGYLTRRIALERKGREWYDRTFLPRIGPITLYGLLFTIVLLFAIQGDTITSQPLDVARIALPLLVYFAGMWIAGFAIGWLSGLPYPQTASLAFTVASNDFELAIAVAVGVFGATSGQALAGVVGPLIEVPVLIGLVYVALWARRFWRAPRAPPSAAR